MSSKQRHVAAFEIKTAAYQVNLRTKMYWTKVFLSLTQIFVYESQILKIELNKNTSAAKDSH